MRLSDAAYSLDHAQLLATLAATDKLLLIQDLDGVCMGLVRDPLTRRIDRRYVEAAGRLDGHFQVLTNGEHIGRRGVNGIVDQAFDTPGHAARHGGYLPGLAGGGVQLQDRHGNVSHPGVSEEELAFLAAVPARAIRFLTETLTAPPYALDAVTIDTLLQASVLDNRVSPTINLNHFHQRLHTRPDDYRQLQQQVAAFMGGLLQQASEQGLRDSFFLHYAPNLGRDAAGNERLRLGDAGSAGTHDFQFMLKGAIKEVGVLVILNHYYRRHTGEYPLGEHFNAREAPRDSQALLQLVRDRFNPQHMPRIVGIGDTVTAYAQDGDAGVARGGSDRGFLTLVQDIGRAFDTDNAVLYVDSSRGELRRPGVDAALLQRRMSEPDVAPWPALVDISDPDDPLTFNFIFPGGHVQYVEFFCSLAQRFNTRLHSDATA